MANSQYFILVEDRCQTNFSSCSNPIQRNLFQTKINTSISSSTQFTTSSLPENGMEISDEDDEMEQTPTFGRQSSLSVLDKRYVEGLKSN